MKYKIGDKVRLVSNTAILEEVYLSRSLEGHEGEITRIDDNSRFNGTPAPYLIMLVENNHIAVGDKQIEGLVKIGNWKRVIEDGV